MKYLTLIRAIALLHQYQREIKTVNHNGQVLSYVEVAKDDIAVANRLANDVLGRTLDELPPQSRKLLKHIYRMTVDACKQQQIEQSDYRFSRKAIREFTRWGNTQLKVHLKRLEDMEYLLVHRGGRGQSFVYELLYRGEGEQGESFLSGLIDIEKLGYDEKKSGLNDGLSGSSRPQVGGKSDRGRPAKKPAKPSVARVYCESDQTAPKNTSKDKNVSASHRNDHFPLAAAAE